MNLTEKLNGSQLDIALEGRLDTNTAPELESVIKRSLEGVTLLILDMAELTYLSSAGLRVLLSTHKQMLKQGKLQIRHVNETIMEVFEVTGFIDILTIE